MALTYSSRNAWNVTKRPACHAERHHNFLWHLSGFCTCLPHRHGIFTAPTVVHTYSSSNTWNVTQCHACSEKQHHNFLWHVFAASRGLVNAPLCVFWTSPSIFVGNYIPNSWMMFNLDISQPLYSPIDTASLAPRRPCADRCEHQSDVKRTRLIPHTAM